MPILKHDTVLNIDYRIWEVEEAESFFMEKVNLDLKGIQKYKTISCDTRRREWLAGRYLVQEITGTNLPVQVDQYGKPYVQDVSTEISISHSHGKVAASKSSIPCGLDLQKLFDKIERIQYKFANELELASLDEFNKKKHLHIYWSAKEALYKTYGKRSLDFKEHIKLDPFHCVKEKGMFKGIVEKEDYRQTYEIAYEFIEDYVVVNAIENE